jgi:hypothetical protein
MPVDGDQMVLVEVSEQDGEGWSRVSRTGDLAQATAKSLREAMIGIKPAVSTILAELRDGVEVPDCVTLAFGVKLAAEAGVVVARTATEAHFTVTVEWRRSDQP